MSHLLTKQKQALVALSTAKAEYMAFENCCAQIFWMKQQLGDYGLKLIKIPILCNNTSGAIILTKNLIQHSRTKHIEIKHHFIRDYIHRRDIELNFINSKNQLVDIFTKPLHEHQYFFIRNKVGMINLN